MFPHLLSNLSHINNKHNLCWVSKMSSISPFFLSFSVYIYHITQLNNHALRPSSWLNIGLDILFSNASILVFLSEFMIKYWKMTCLHLYMKVGWVSWCLQVYLKTPTKSNLTIKPQIRIPSSTLWRFDKDLEIYSSILDGD